MPFVSSIRRQHIQPEITSDSLLDHFEITGGDEIYTAGGYRIHVFTQTGESELSITPRHSENMMHLQPTNLAAEYLVLAGGASGGKGIAGGGGAGGYREGVLELTTGSQPVVVGAGGPPSGGPAPRYTVGHRGENSTFASITSQGGGGGGTHNPGATRTPGYDGDGRTGGSGGSGGGGGGGGPSPYPGGGGGGAGGYGINSPVRRHPGGSGTTNQGHAGGWGGGNEGNYSGPGGPGLASSITGSTLTRAGGGGGGNHSGQSGLGGPGGGTPGRTGSAPTASAPNNSGSGSGGGGHSPNGPSGRGGPGIVVVRYKI